MKRIEIPIIEKKDSIINKKEDTCSIYEYYKGIDDELIWEKYIKNIPFNKNDLIYLYNVYNRRIDDILVTKIIRYNGKRNVYEDMAKIFDCREEEVTKSQNEFKKNPDKYVVLLDSLDINKDNINEFNFDCEPKLRYIYGSCNTPSIITSKNFFKKLESIGGNVFFNSLTNSYELESLKTVRGNAYFGSLTSVKGLANLEYIGGFVNFYKLLSLDGLDNLKYIGDIENSVFGSLNNKKRIKTLVRKK